MLSASTNYGLRWLIMWILHQNMCFQMGGEKSEEVYIKKEKSTPQWREEFI